MIGTLNNENLNDINLFSLNKINVVGLDKKDNLKLIDKLNFLELNNLFFLNKTKITEVINSNKLIEKYTIYKNYPSTLNIKVYKTNFLAQINKDGKIFLLGSNGKLIKTQNLEKDIPFIFGNFNNKNFFELKNAIDETSFDYTIVKNLFFFKSGRWDIETNNGLIVRLPKDEIKKSIELLIRIIAKDDKKKINKIDLRQLNQIIVNE